MAIDSSLDAMKYTAITRKVDHTLLAPTATWSEVRKVLDDSIKYQVASACISPCYVAQAREYVGDALPICTVIGFPNGYNSTAAKVFEAQQAIREGAEEIDMVIQLGWVKDQNYDAVLEELQAMRQAAGKKILKVIIETCLLTDEEKITLCEVVTKAKADFIKTSTGFSSGGATPRDIMLFSQYVGPDVKIKASGGISTLDDAQHFLNLGASRLGTSRIVKILNNLEADGY